MYTESIPIQRIFPIRALVTSADGPKIVVKTSMIWYVGRRRNT